MTNAQHDLRTPAIAVAVASHDRPVRLRWLLNALEEQTLDRRRFEVVVAHDSAGEETMEVLERHPLARAGALRHVRFDPSREPSIARLRNAAWREARAPVIAFTDDDCRPAKDWVERALAASLESPGAIVQGMTVPDPEEAINERAPWVHTQRIVPPVPWAQACNIVYPRALLERANGFVEDPALHVGEDMDLALRARRLGAGYVGAREALVYHAVQPAGLARRLRSLLRWRDLTFVVKRHPHARRHFPLWAFWKRTHVWLPFALLGVAGARRNPLRALMAVPWVVHTAPVRGSSVRGRFRTLSELPGRFAIDVTEVAALAWGSVKHRTLLL